MTGPGSGLLFIRWSRDLRWARRARKKVLVPPLRRLLLRADSKAIWTAGARATEAAHFVYRAAGLAGCAQDAAA